jgi:hypothetical protein
VTTRSTHKYLKKSTRCRNPRPGAVLMVGIEDRIPVLAKIPREERRAAQAVEGGTGVEA